jgi:hypothetical protein
MVAENVAVEGRCIAQPAAARHADVFALARRKFLEQSPKDMVLVFVEDDDVDNQFFDRSRKLAADRARLPGRAFWTGRPIVELTKPTNVTPRAVAVIGTSPRPPARIRHGATFGRTTRIVTRRRDFLSGFA